MKALVLHKYGSVGSLVYQDIEKPKITKPTEILIKVNACSCNPGDVYLCSGIISLVLPLKFPAIVGLDFSGTIEEIGSGVTSFAVGQEVHGQFTTPKSNGTFAEYIVVNQKNDVIIPKPSCISHAEAAAFGTAGTTAYQGIVDDCKLKQGQRILVIGAAGGVGSYSVLVSKALGANVTGICSTKNIDIVNKYGADKVIDYKSDNFMTELNNCEKFDCIMDTVGGDNYYFNFKKFLKNGGIYTSAVVGPHIHGFGDKFSFSTLIFSLIKSKWRGMFGSITYKLVVNEGSKNAPFYQKINQLYESGQLKSPFIESVPLKDGTFALVRLERHEITGKLVLIP